MKKVLWDRHQVVVVELLIEVLEHGDPLDNVEGVEVIAILSRPGLGWVEKKMFKFLVLKIWMSFNHLLLL